MRKALENNDYKSKSIANIYTLTQILAIATHVPTSGYLCNIINKKEKQYRCLCQDGRNMREADHRCPCQYFLFYIKFKNKIIRY